MHRRPARRRKVTMEHYVFQKEELLNILNNVEKEFTKTILPSINDLIKETKGKTNILDSILATNFKKVKHSIDDDSDIFKMTLDALNKYKNILGSLRDRINDVIDDTLSSNSSDLNKRLILALTSEGTFFVENIPLIITNAINRFYLKEKSSFDTEIKSSIAGKTTTFFTLVPELYKADLDAVVNAIGNIPTIQTLKMEKISDIPSEIVVMDFLSKKFNFKDLFTKSMVGKMLDIVSFKSNTTHSKSSKHHHKDTRVKIKSENIGLATNFIGNPIYHLRLFLVDLSLMRLENLKEKRNLLELKLLELKSAQNGQDTSKLKKQIEFYEEKLNKLDLKIQKYMEVRVHH